MTSRRLRQLLGLALLVPLLFAVLLGGAASRAQEAEPDTGPDEVTAEVLPDDPVWLELQDWVSQLRGLPVLRPVPRVALSLAAFRARQAELYRAYVDQTELDRLRDLLVGLGVLDDGVDLASVLVELYSALPLATYDPLDHTIYLRRSLDPAGPLGRMVLAHELTHALQDQHYNLQRLYRRPSDNADRDQAIAALLEGDAIIVQRMYLATTQPETEEEQVVQEAAFQEALEQVYAEIRETLSLDFERLPAPIVEQVYVPYLDGPGFIQRVVGAQALTEWGRYGPAVRPLFLRPPQSTAEVLHPEKYLRGWQPQPVELPDPASALGPDWLLLRRQVVGELDHRALLARDLPSDEAAAVAAGWAGNRALVLADGTGQMATVSATLWETPAAAAAWSEAYARAVAARAERQARLVWAEHGRRIWETPEQAILLEVLGDRSLHVQAPTVAAAEALADALSGRRLPDARDALARLRRAW